MVLERTPKRWNNEYQQPEKRKRKSFDDIEKALKICSTGKGKRCQECPYNDSETCRDRLMSDAHMIILYQWGHIKCAENDTAKRMEVDK